MKGFILVLICFIILFSLLASCSMSFVEYTKIKEQTKQIQIITQAQIEIEQIRADTLKQTDFSYIIFYVVRFLLFVGSVLWVFIISLWIIKRIK